MAILDNVKNSLGISHSKKDGEITGVIAAAQQELRAAGVGAIDTADSLTEVAILLYVRAWFNYQGEGERYQKAFERLRDTMALSGLYAPTEEADPDGT